jgi:chaperone protein EcpD
MMLRMRSLATSIVMALFLGVGVAHASVVITGTRVVYPEAEPEVTVKLTNDGPSPALVQVWLDDGKPNALPDESKVPFTVVPPLFRLDSGKGQSLRLIYTHEALPKDRESVFWLDVLEVPPRNARQANDPNTMRLAFRTRVKVFFRPSGLKGDVDDAATQVQWKFAPRVSGGYELEATNPTPYHVTFSRIKAEAGTSSWNNGKGGMLDPGGSEDFDVGDVRTLPTSPLTVEYTYINDYGAGVNGRFDRKKNK